jgi:hypothetical protein
MTPLTVIIYPLPDFLNTIMYYPTYLLTYPAAMLFGFLIGLLFLWLVGLCVGRVGVQYSTTMHVRAHQHMLCPELIIKHIRTYDHDAQWTISASAPSETGALLAARSFTHGPAVGFPHFCNKYMNCM